MRRVILATLIVAAVGLIGFGAPANASPTDHPAVMANNGPTAYKFAQGTCMTPTSTGDITIFAGDSVTWTNCTQVAHTVSSDDTPPAWTDSGDVNHNETFKLTFHTPGTFKYHCSIHTYMTGSVVVQPAPATTTTEKATTTTAQPTVAPTSTTAKATTTTTNPAVTTTTEDINGVFGSESSTSQEPSTTEFTTETTRALGTGGGGTSAGVVAALVVGLGAVGTAVALIIRRMRAGAGPL